MDNFNTTHMGQFKAKYIFIKGQQVGNSIYSHETSIDVRKDRKKRELWFICKCENVFIGIPRRLLDGTQNGCGCLLTNGMKEKYHGLITNGKPTPECRAWYNMRDRCLSTKSKLYKYYGGRGVNICDRWLGSDGLKNFIGDMGERPTSKHSLDRFPDMDGNYSPENCRWATKKEQSSNTRRNVFLTYLNKTLTITQWAEKLNMKPITLINRNRLGWPVEEILRTTKFLHHKQQANG